MLTRPIREVVRATPTCANRANRSRPAISFRTPPARPCASRRTGTPTRKPYSIAAAPEDADARGPPRAAHRRRRKRRRRIASLARARHARRCRGPARQLHLPADPPEQRFVFIAGGTGIAPLRAMLRHALRIPHREIGVLYSARGPDEFAYHDELVELARDAAHRAPSDDHARTRPASGVAVAAASDARSWRRSCMIRRRSASSADRPRSWMEPGSCSRSWGSRRNEYGSRSGESSDYRLRGPSRGSRRRPSRFRR